MTGEAGGSVRTHCRGVMPSNESCAVSLDFLAIDFETANPKRASVCQIGVAKVRGGEVVSTACHPVFPPRGFTNFHERNIAVHGLTPKYVYGAQGWPDILARLIRFAGPLPLVAHNAAFERSVIVQASEAEKIQAPDFTYLCSAKIARKVLPGLENYRLDTLIREMGLPAFSHHDAGDDAVACAQLVIALAERAGTDDPAALLPAARRRSTTGSAAHV